MELDDVGEAGQIAPEEAEAEHVAVVEEVDYHLHYLSSQYLASVAAVLKQTVLEESFFCPRILPGATDLDSRLNLVSKKLAAFIPYREREEKKVKTGLIFLD